MVELKLSRLWLRDLLFAISVYVYRNEIYFVCLILSSSTATETVVCLHKYSTNSLLFSTKVILMMSSTILFVGVNSNASLKS